MNVHVPPGHLMVGVICIDHFPDSRTMEAIDRAHINLFNTRGWHTTQVKAFGCSDLCDSRNQLAAHFFHEKQFTHALFVDADVSWEPGAVERMVQHPVDFVLGAYPRRAEGQGYPIKTIPGPIECVDPATGRPHPDGLIKIAGGGAGFMRLSRRCIERMVEAYEDRWYFKVGSRSNKAWNLFEFSVINHERKSEDINFCQMWTALGEDLWCDPHLMLHHHGFKSFSGRLYDHLMDLGRIIDGKTVARIESE